LIIWLWLVEVVVLEQAVVQAVEVVAGPVVIVLDQDFL
jgi:hypothetical protein